MQELLALAKKADQADVPDGMSLSGEIKRRTDWMAVMAEAKRRIVARVRERSARKKSEHGEKMTQRASNEKAGSKKSNRKLPKAPEAGPKDSDQINLTDEELRTTPTARGGFEQTIL